MSNQGGSDQGTDNASQRIAEALTRLQWRRGPGGGPRGFGLPGGAAGFGGHPGFGGPGRGDVPFGRGRHEEEHDWKGRFGAHLGGRAQLRLLIALAQAGRSLGVSAIGESIGVDQPRASRLVSQGVELGLLQREVDPDDARRTLIALTEKGRAISNRFRGAQRESVDLALDGFTDEERALLAQLLSRLADAWPR